LTHLPRRGTLLLLAALAGVGLTAAAPAAPAARTAAPKVTFLSPKPGARIAGHAPISLGLRFRKPVLVTAVLDAKPIWTARSKGGRVVLGRRWDTARAGNGRHRLRIVVWRRGDKKPLADLRRTILIANAVAARGAAGPAVAPTAPAPVRPATPAPAPQASVPPPGAVSLPGTIVWRGDYETGDLSQFRDDDGDVVQPQQGAPGRITVVTSPVAEGRYAGRFELHPGDSYAGGNRAEMFHYTHDREGTEGWYSWYTLFPTDFPRETNLGWQIWTQWHSTLSISAPPVKFTAKGDQISFGTDKKPTLWTGPMNRGQWQAIRLHAFWSSDPAKGFVELWVNGTLVVPKTYDKTLIAGYDNYWKQGLYRSPDASTTAVIYHDGAAMSRG
jgi:Polysaccharide lyase